jgi:hypothetical protein
MYNHSQIELISAAPCKIQQQEIGNQLHILRTEAMT